MFARKNITINSNDKPWMDLLLLRIVRGFLVIALRKFLYLETGWEL